LIRRRFALRRERGSAYDGETRSFMLLLALFVASTIEPWVLHVFHIDPEILGERPSLRELAEVPLITFFDYIQGGEPLSEFLEDFPTVTSGASERNCWRA